MKMVFGHHEPGRVQSLQETYPEVLFVVPTSPEEVLREITDADAFCGHPTAEQFAAAKKLRWVQFLSAGAEFVRNVPDLVASDVPVTNVKGAFSATIAEHAMAMLLALARDIPFWLNRKAEHVWGPGNDQPHMVGVAGMTMGVVGFGSIGRAIAKRALGFEMSVIGIDIHQVSPMDGVEEVITLDRLPEFLPQIDALMIAAPITPLTRGMVGPTVINLLKPGAYLVAISRGGIVDETALISALRDGQLAGAGLDVTVKEPLPSNSPLWDVENLIITPHNSGASRLTGDLRWQLVSENIGHFLRGEPLINVIDKRLGY